MPGRSIPWLPSPSPWYFSGSPRSSSASAQWTTLANMLTPPRNRTAGPSPNVRHVVNQPTANAWSSAETPTAATSTNVGRNQPHSGSSCPRRTKGETHMSETTRPPPSQSIATIQAPPHPLRHANGTAMPATPVGHRRGLRMGPQLEHGRPGVGVEIRARTGNERSSVPPRK